MTYTVRTSTGQSDTVDTPRVENVVRIAVDIMKALDQEIWVRVFDDRKELVFTAR